METRRLNRRVLIQKPGTVQDAAGQQVPGWTNIIATGDGKVWANIRTLNGIETIKSDAQASVVKASIRIRRRTDVTAAMRVIHGTTTYQILAVLPDEERREYVDLSCEVVTGSA